MKKPAEFLLLLSAAFFFNATAGRNFVLIGSAAAPVKYIRGNGSNIGLYAGIELQPGAITYQNEALAKSVSFLRPVSLGAFKRGKNYVPGTGSQGMGKKTVVAAQPMPLTFKSSNRTLFKLTGAHSSGLAKMMATTSATPFQLLPFSWINFPESSSSTYELLLPILCQDQYMDVPSTNANANFTNEQLDTNSAKTYIGIYRIDQFLNDNIATRIWSDGENVLYYPSEVSAFELLLLSNSDFLLDSTNQEPNNAGYYIVKHLFIDPSRANFAIWAARGQQNEQACKAGLDHILVTNNKPPSSDSQAISIYQFNHVVFAFAQMPSFEAKFRAPDCTLPPPP